MSSKIEVYDEGDSMNIIWSQHNLSLDCKSSKIFPNKNVSKVNDIKVAGLGVWLKK
jgi:hypothetical protein